MICSHWKSWTILILAVAVHAAAADHSRGGSQRQHAAPQAARAGRQLTPDENGNYKFEFTDDAGSFRQESGTVKQLGNEQASEVNGQYGWTSPEGEQVQFSYTANENGYQASGSHLPQQVQSDNLHHQKAQELLARVNGR